MKVKKDANGAAAADEKEEEDEPTSFYEDEENLKKLCNFLRGKHGPPVREGTLMEKRVHYIKGMQ